MDFVIYEHDYDLLELLQKNTESGLSFKEIVTLLARSALEIYRTLNKLRKWNIVTLLDYDHAHYKVTGDNHKVTIRRVRCPSCGTIKRVHEEDQARTKCINPDCTTSGGKEKHFEILSREFLKVGIKRRINHV